MLGIDYGSMFREDRFYRFGTYAMSKYAQALFSIELSRRHPDLVVHAVDPGLVRTAIFRYDPFFDWVRGVVETLVPMVFKSSKDGALTLIWAALCKGKDEWGLLQDLRRAPKAWPLERDLRMGEGDKLWSLSENVTGAGR